MNFSLNKIAIRILAAAAAIIVVFFAVRFAVQRLIVQAQPAQSSAANEDLRAFAALEPIDTHVHAFKSDPQFTDLLARLRLHLLDICVADNHGIYGELATELARAQGFVGSSQGHAKLCVTFDPYSFQQNGYGQNIIEQLRQEFADGAIAVKIWKNIGMEIRTADGRYVMPDDPIFQPIYRAIAAENKTLIAHVAEPTSCWQPPTTDSPAYDY